MLKLNVFGKKFGVLKIKCYLCNDNYWVAYWIDIYLMNKTRLRK